MHLRLLQHVQNVLKRITSQNRKLLELGLGWAKNGTFGDDAKSTFCTYEQMLQVVTSVIFSKRRDVVEDLPIR